jgi:uncharacterized protein YecE (DUF72 family)
MESLLRIGCAGWAIPKEQRPSFPSAGSHLERYAQRFAAVEINSSFHRPHLRATYVRWAASVPDDFAFAVKAPKEITHRLRLIDAGVALDEFLAQVSGLGGKLGPLLFQLPPGLAFDAQAARSFFAALRKRFEGNVVCEPRHPGWFTLAADDLMMELAISRAVADPAIVAAAADPGGWTGLLYFRLHGSPRIYYSEYSADEIEGLADRLARAKSDGQPAWCIFDNTAAGAAMTNALALLECLRRR